MSKTSKHFYSVWKLICLFGLVGASFAVSAPSQAHPDHDDGQLRGICSWRQDLTNIVLEEEEDLTAEECNYWCYDSRDPKKIFGAISDEELFDNGYCEWLPDFSQLGPLTPPGGYNTCPDGSAPGLYGCDPEKH